MGEWKSAGPFEVYLPDGVPCIHPACENSAVRVRQVSERVRLLSCSRAQWMAFVQAVKAAQFDTEVPGDGS